MEYSGAFFKTYQTVAAYEKALERHGQYIRWTRALICPCLNPVTMQPNTKCPLCHGRGRLYRTPGNMHVRYELASHTNHGVITPKHTPVVVGTAKVYRQGTSVTLAAPQPADGMTIVLNPPYWKDWERLTMEYEFSPKISVTAENCQVVSTNTLRTIATIFRYRGKEFQGTVDSVSRVYNVTKSETYVVSDFKKEYIYLSSMGTYTPGDVLQVDYQYVQPYNFLLIGITEKMRYASPYIVPEATSVLVTPYYCKVSPDDLLTALSADLIGSAIVDPTQTAGNDVINNFYDLSKILEVIDTTGTRYTPGVDCELYGRNEIKWLVTKPTLKYAVQFFYHPTYIALKEYSTLRNSENKEFVNKINLIQYDQVNAKRTF